MGARCRAPAEIWIELLSLELDWAGLKEQGIDGALTLSTHRSSHKWATDQYRSFTSLPTLIENGEIL